MNDYVALKMRGLPFSARHQDVMMFFNPHKVIPDSIKLGRNNSGQSTGVGCVLFEDRDQCQAAMNDK